MLSTYSNQKENRFICGSGVKEQLIFPDWIRTGYVSRSQEAIL